MDIPGFQVMFKLVYGYNAWRRRRPKSHTAISPGSMLHYLPSSLIIKDDLEYGYSLMSIWDVSLYTYIVHRFTKGQFSYTMLQLDYLIS